MDNRPRLLVTLEGYAVEGGFDRPYEPATNYSPTIALGRHPGPGDAEGLWNDYEQVIDLVVSMGLDGVRLTLEWARIEPRPGRIDVAALERYAKVVRHARALGLQVTLVLVDAAWPSWLGLEAWLLPWVVPHVLAHADRVAQHVGADATGVVAFARPSLLVGGGYLRGEGPPWRQRGVEDALAAQRQIERVERELASHALIGPLLVGSSADVTLDRTASQIASWRAQSRDVDELYVRSLVRGRGPTASARGLLEKDSNGWRISAPAELLEALR